jgi:hypothetical protein
MKLFLSQQCIPVQRNLFTSEEIQMTLSMSLNRAYAECRESQKQMGLPASAEIGD